MSLSLKKQVFSDIDNLREYTEKANSLLYASPNLAAEWNYEKNGKLKPENFTVSSHKKVWWICKNGHEWQAMIASRNYGCGCPYCAGRKVLQGFNDLKTVNPSVASGWNFEKNKNWGPEDFTANSSKKVWWICNNGHEWQATIYNRHNGRGCPQCAKEKRKKSK